MDKETIVCMAPLKSLGTLLALSMLAQARSGGSSYVGSKACYGCHPAIYQSFRQTDMGRSMSLARDWKPGAAPTEFTVTQPGTSRQFSLSHSQSGWQQTESEAGVYSVDYPLDYVVGSGNNGLSFLIRRGSFLFEAPLSFYSKVNEWNLSPGYEKTDLGFSRKVPEECINCHAGRPSPLNSASGSYADPPFQELAVGCENCHGPGELHIKSAGKAAGAIVNPAKLSARLADNICLNCHQAGNARVLQPGKSYLDFRPGQWLFDTAIVFKAPTRAEDQQSDLLEHFSAMQSSRCFRESAGKMSCLTCHNPHVQPRQESALAAYRPKCLTCHTEQTCRIPLAVRAAQSPPDDCVGCHMPKRVVTQISHSALTNHRIPARQDEPLPPLQQAVRDGLVVVNPPGQSNFQVAKLLLLRAYRQMAQSNSEYQQRYLSTLDELEKTQSQDTFVQAALGDRALTEGRMDDAITHLKLALPLGNAVVNLELGQSLAKAGQYDEAIEYLKKGVELDPYDAVMRKTLILQYINVKSYSEAERLMRQYVADFPEDSFMRSLLARVSK